MIFKKQPCKKYSALFFNLVTIIVILGASAYASDDSISGTAGDGHAKKAQMRVIVIAPSSSHLLSALPKPSTPQLETVSTDFHQRLRTTFAEFKDLSALSEKLSHHFQAVLSDRSDIRAAVSESLQWDVGLFGIAYTQILLKSADELGKDDTRSSVIMNTIYHSFLKGYGQNLTTSITPRPTSVMTDSQHEVAMTVTAKRFHDAFVKFKTLNARAGRLLSLPDSSLQHDIERSCLLSPIKFGIVYTRIFLMIPNMTVPSDIQKLLKPFLPPEEDLKSALQPPPSSPMSITVDVDGSQSPQSPHQLHPNLNGFMSTGTATTAATASSVSTNGSGGVASGSGATPPKESCCSCCCPCWFKFWGWFGC